RYLSMLGRVSRPRRASARSAPRRAVGRERPDHGRRRRAMAREDQAGTEAGMTRTTSSTDAVYLLPVRWAQARDPAETTAYLRTIAEVMDVVVVDSSPGPVFAQNYAAWHDVVRHVRAAEHPPGTNGKVANVLAGLATAAHELVVVADD